MAERSELRATLNACYWQTALFRLIFVSMKITAYMQARAAISMLAFAVLNHCQAFTI